MANRKEELVEYLTSKGLEPQVEEFGIFFRYQNSNFWFLTDDEDQQYLRLIMPGVMDVDKNNRIDVLEACNSVTNEVKVAKCFISDNSDVWISCEQLLDDDPKFGDIIPRSLRIMLTGYASFLEAVGA